MHSSSFLLRPRKRIRREATGAAALRRPARHNALDALGMAQRARAATRIIKRAIHRNDNDAHAVPRDAVRAAAAGTVPAAGPAGHAGHAGRGRANTGRAAAGKPTIKGGTAKNNTASASACLREGKRFAQWWWSSPLCRGAAATIKAAVLLGAVQGTVLGKGGMVGEMLPTYRRAYAAGCLPSGGFWSRWGGGRPRPSCWRSAAVGGLVADAGAFGTGLAGSVIGQSRVLAGLCSRYGQAAVMGSQTRHNAPPPFLRSSLSPSSG